MVVSQSDITFRCIACHFICPPKAMHEISKKGVTLLSSVKRPTIPKAEGAGIIANLLLPEYIYILLSMSLIE